jgi:hypothetical protein
MHAPYHRRRSIHRAAAPHRDADGGGAMSTHVRRQSGTGRGARLARPALFTMTLLVLLLLVPATANADVMAKYRTKYKNKLNSYERKMDLEYDFYSTSTTACQSHTDTIQMALNDPDLQTQIPQLEQAALWERELLRDAISKSRTAIYANIAAFKATGVKWFKTKADKNRFKTRLTVMRSGFVQIFLADDCLLDCLSALGMSADVATAKDRLQTASYTRTNAEASFEKGMKQLRALQ